MAQEYAISGTTLTALADAVRKNVGETKLIQTGVREPEVKISKTTNATSFTEHSGGYGNNKAVYDVVSFPGASKIVVDIAYQTENTNYDYVQIAVGPVSSPPSTSTYPKYGGATLTRKELTFENTDTITFYFKTDSSADAYLGYYAECRAYDGEGNLYRQPIYEEVPNTMTVDTMISTINNLSSGGGGKGNLSIGDLYLDVKDYSLGSSSGAQTAIIKNISIKKGFIFGLLTVNGYISNTATSQSADYRGYCMTSLFYFKSDGTLQHHTLDTNVSRENCAMIYGLNSMTADLQNDIKANNGNITIDNGKINLALTGYPDGNNYGYILKSSSSQYSINNIKVRQFYKA